jgi:hypothetical protein
LTFNSFDYLKSDVRNLSRYMAELEELIEGYRAFVSNAILARHSDEVTRRKLLKKTQKVIGPVEDVHSQGCQEIKGQQRNGESLAQAP